MAEVVGETDDTVEIHDFPEDGDVAKGFIVARSMDNLVEDVGLRFRRVLVFAINDNRVPFNLNERKRVNVTPSGLVPLDDGSRRSIPKYRFYFRHTANAIVKDSRFQDLI